MTDPFRAPEPLRPPPKPPRMVHADAATSSERREAPAREQAPPLPSRASPPPLPTRPGTSSKEVSHDRALREGAMRKLERGKWQRYWFVLTEEKVCYFSGDALCGQIGLNGLVVQDASLGFALRSPEASFVVDGDFGWKKALASAARGDRSAQNLAPIFCEKSATCQRCGAAFTFLKTRQHCWQCGSMVCHACSTEQIPIDREGGRLRRVCDPCYSSYAESRQYGRR